MLCSSYQFLFPTLFRWVISLCLAGSCDLLGKNLEMLSLVSVPLRYIALGLAAVIAALAIEIVYRFHTQGVREVLLVPFLLLSAFIGLVTLIQVILSRVEVTELTPTNTEDDALYDSAASAGGVIRGDNPIRRIKDDTLGREEPARSFAKQVLGVDAGEGVVVGVLGPWGSGKTSFINLARIEFEQAGVPIIDFNPWMFSGAQQLVEYFFIELAAQLKVRKGLSDIGKSLEEYGEMFSGAGWVPVIGPWIERGRGVARIVSKILQRRKEGIGGRRDKLRHALGNLKTPIVVVLDDIDRLSSPEIRDVFKLVRLTASFPNVVYLVAFDRIRVEQALSEEGVPGRDYLEKILQVAVDLP